LGTGISRPIGGQLKEILNLTREVALARRIGKMLPQSSKESEEKEEAWPSQPEYESRDTGMLHPLPRPPLDEEIAEDWEELFDETPFWPQPLPQIIAVDCPTGLNSDTGAVDPATVPADLTVTFAYPKWGQFLFPGEEACGELLVADIGTPPELGEAIKTEYVSPDMVRALLPTRSRSAHKGTFGKALIVAGSLYYTGAAYLAGAAATRVGTGLVTLAVPRPLQAILAAHLYETTWLPLPHDMGVLAPDAVRILDEHMGGYDALLLGPGLSREKATQQFVERFLAPLSASSQGHLGFVPTDPHEVTSSARRAQLPLIVDADGLNCLAQVEGWQHQLPENSILTPHPGEMARLCGCSTAEVNANRWNIAREKAVEWGHIIVLKGAHTVVAAPDGRLAVHPFANPALATAGTGDVLAGAIVGMLAQGLAPFEAAVVGVYLHGLAGELARRDIGSAGAVAGDLIPRLPRAINCLR